MGGYAMSKFLIATFGSLGDLYPYVAIGLELQERGHEVVVGTSPCYRQRVESLGLGFHPIRPDSEWLNDPDKVRRLGHPRWGLLRVGREWLMPALRDSYDDTLAAAQGADVLVTMLAAYATRLVAEKTGICWASAVHIPMGFFSTYDPPVLEICPALSMAARPLGPPFWKPLFWCGKRVSRYMARPWYQLRREIGLPPTIEGNPLADSQSPHLVLALFSKLLADKQPDWPQQSVVTGFAFHDGDGQRRLSASLDGFLAAAAPPIIFTLGSAVSGNAGDFFAQSLECAKLLNRRAVVVVGQGFQGRLPNVTEDAVVVDYAPFAELFPRAAAVVHHGGVGTTGLAMRAGRPMLVVPHAWDQFDNAARVVRLGIARTVSKHRFTPDRAAAELKRLLDDPVCAQRASNVGEQIRNEHGAKAACDALEYLIRKK